MVVVHVIGRSVGKLILYLSRLHAPVRTHVQLLLASGPAQAHDQAPAICFRRNFLAVNDDELGVLIVGKATHFSAAVRAKMS